MSSDLLYKLDPGHCYTLITDPDYSDILQAKLFYEIERSTYFVIRVRFNEDMLSPRNETLAALKEARKAGCKCYLIFLANGIQMNRFLRFIDRFVQHFFSFFVDKFQQLLEKRCDFFFLINFLHSQ